MKWIENMAPAPFGLVIWCFTTVGIFAGIWANMDYHTCPAPAMPTRAEVQLMLRDRGHDIVVDGKIGSDSNEKWEIEEKKIMDDDMADLIDRFGGVNGDEPK